MRDDTRAGIAGIAAFALSFLFGLQLRFFTELDGRVTMLYKYEYLLFAKKKGI